MPECPNHLVAIIDDDVAVVDSLKFMLEAAGQRVAAYTSADAFLKDGAARPMCLILDHLMPRMTGLELAARLRAAGSALPILLVTGSPSPDIAARAASLGIAAVAEKPLDENQVLQFVNTHRQRSRSGGSGPRSRGEHEPDEAR